MSFSSLKFLFTLDRAVWPTLHTVHFNPNKLLYFLVTSFFASLFSYAFNWFIVLRLWSITMHNILMKVHIYVYNDKISAVNICQIKDYGRTMWYLYIFEHMVQRPGSLTAFFRKYYKYCKYFIIINKNSR